MKSLFFTKPKTNTLKCLKFLCEQGETVLGVIIHDSPKYIGGSFCEFCRENNIRIYNGNEVYSEINTFKENLDVIYVNTYPELIRSDLIDSAKKGAVNFHMAPLPKYRGVFGYNFAIYNQEKQYGVTAHRLSNQFDRGDLIEVDMFDIYPDKITVKELVELSEEHLFELFKRTYYRIKRGEKINYLEQGEGKYYSRKDFENLKQIKESDTADIIRRKIRAFWYPPYEGAYIVLDGERYGLVTEELLNQYGESTKNYGQ